MNMHKTIKYKTKNEILAARSEEEKKKHNNNKIYDGMR